MREGEGKQLRMGQGSRRTATRATSVMAQLFIVKDREAVAAETGDVPLPSIFTRLDMTDDMSAYIRPAIEPGVAMLRRAQQF